MTSSLVNEQSKLGEGPSPASEEAQRIERLKQLRKKKLRNALLFFAFVGPNLALIATFIYYPLGMNMFFSTLDWRMGSTSATSIGLQNYKEFFTSPGGLEVWRVTIIFTVATVAGAMGIGMLLALVLNRKLPGRGITRTAVFSPYVLSGVGVGLVWNFIFDPNIGILRFFFSWLGKESPQWFTNPTLSLVMVIIVYIWKNLGYAAVIFIAGLQTIPSDLLEAASIDGAGPVRRFFSITFPLLTPTVFFLLIATTLNSMQAFDLLRTMTPTGNGTNTLIFEIYLQGFGTYQRAGYAATISVVLFATLFLLTFVQMRFVERKVHYE